MKDNQEAEMSTLAFTFQSASVSTGRIWSVETLTSEGWYYLGKVVEKGWHDEPVFDYDPEATLVRGLTVETLVVITDFLRNIDSNENDSQNVPYVAST